MTLTIAPFMVNLFLYLIVLGIGIDFTWCGYWYLTTKEINRLPKLLGYLMFRIIQTGINKKQSSIKFVRTILSMKAMGIYLLLGGPLLILGSIFALLGTLPYLK
jgi:hypothetical protein